MTSNFIFYSSETDIIFSPHTCKCYLKNALITHIFGRVGKSNSRKRTQHAFLLPSVTLASAQNLYFP